MSTKVTAGAANGRDRPVVDLHTNGSYLFPIRSPAHLTPLQVPLQLGMSKLPFVFDSLVLRSDDLNSSPSTVLHLPTGTQPRATTACRLPGKPMAELHSIITNGRTIGHEFCIDRRAPGVPCKCAAVERVGMWQTVRRVRGSCGMDSGLGAVPSDFRSSNIFVKLGENVGANGIDHIVEDFGKLGLALTVN